MKAAFGALAVLLVTLFVRAAHASELEVVAEAATSVDPARLEALLRIELADTPRPIRVVLRSSPLPRHVDAVVTFDDGSTESRTLDLTDTDPTEAARVVALALAEACRIHVAPPKLELLPRGDERGTSSGARTEPPRQVTFGARASVGLRVLTSSPLVGPEARLGMTAQMASGLGAFAGVSYATYGATDTLGAVRVHAFAGNLGASYSVALGARGRLALGPRLDVGVADASADASSGARASSARAPTFAALLAVEALLRLTDRVSAGLTIDGGAAFVGLDLLADGREVALVRGATLGAGLVFLVEP